MNSTLYSNFISKFGEDQSLGGGFGQALQNNDTDIALKIADVKNTKKLKILINEMRRLI
jgi:hypothetical protein|tara:strand:+ start:236 stop:412 length:177 start_codon:yes stop_codon:yes gene_type:complete